jgi:protoheme IX farnesyltransferase
MISASDLLILMKVRLNALVVFTAAAGYYLAVWGPLDVTDGVIACLGTALVASGAAALNQVAERDLDRLMLRTNDRPVATGRMSSATGGMIAVALGAAGLGALWYAANLTAVAVAFATFLIYVVIYTPMKRHSSLATVIGAVPGALPPLIGWTAAGGALMTLTPWALFAIMFLWQLPHFLAISWLYRDDYARAGLPMLSVIDTDGRMTGRQALVWAAALVPVSLLPSVVGLATPAYAVGALILGVAFTALAGYFAVQRSMASAKLLFLGSITYLPLLWILMAAAKV